MNNIRELRKKRGISQEALAMAMGVRQSTVSRWDSGKMPHASKLPLLAQTLHCTVDELLADQEMKYKAKSDHIA